MVLLRRRLLISAGALLSAPFPVLAQPPKRSPVLGILNPHRKPPPGTPKGPMRTRLEELGWVEGKTLQYEYGYGEGSEARLPELATQLAAKKVDVIWAMGPEAAIAAARATRTIPIVFWGVAFPVEQGLVDSLARPGRNVTGVSWYAAPEVDAKRVELLREIVPAAKRLASIIVPTAVVSVTGEPVKPPVNWVSMVQKLGFERRAFEVTKAEDFEPAFAEILAWKAQALSVVGTALTLRESKRIIEFANRNKLPSAYTLPDFVEHGGLVSYAIDWRPTQARTAEYVDRILRGAKPAELPVDLPGSYVTAVNLKTAKALGITIPQAVLVRADRVYE